MDIDAVNDVKDVIQKRKKTHEHTSIILEYKCNKTVKGMEICRRKKSL